MLLEEHVKAQFLKVFKKDRGGLVKRVEEFVLPSLKLNKDKIEEIPNVSTSPSDMFEKMSLMVDQKLIAAQTAAGDVLSKMCSDIDALKGKKPMADSNSSETSSATLSSHLNHSIVCRRARFQGKPHHCRPCIRHRLDRSRRPVRPVMQPVRPLTQG